MTSGNWLDQSHVSCAMSTGMTHARNIPGRTTTDQTPTVNGILDLRRLILPNTEWRLSQVANGLRRAVGANMLFPEIILLAARDIERFIEENGDERVYHLWEDE